MGESRYFNGCGCIESRKPASGWDVNYEGDIRKLHELGFDGVKFDGACMVWWLGGLAVGGEAGSLAARRRALCVCRAVALWPPQADAG